MLCTGVLCKWCSGILIVSVTFLLILLCLVTSKQVLGWKIVYCGGELCSVFQMHINVEVIGK